MCSPLAIVWVFGQCFETILYQKCIHMSLYLKIRVDLHGTTLTHATSLRQAYDVT